MTLLKREYSTADHSDLTFTNTTFADLEPFGALDVVLHGVHTGQLVAVELNFAADHSASGGLQAFDWETIVSSTVVRRISGLDEGVSGWRAARTSAGEVANISGRFFYTLQADDIATDGTCTLRPVVRTNTGTLTVLADGIHRKIQAAGQSFGTDDVDFLAAGLQYLSDGHHTLTQVLDTFDAAIFEVSSGSGGGVSGSPITPPYVTTDGLIRALGIAGRLSVAVSATDTTMVSDGFRGLPAINFTGLGDSLAKIVLWSADGHDTLTGVEVCSITHHVAGSDTVTVVRGVESSTAQIWDIGSRFSNSATPQDWADVVTGVNQALAGAINAATAVTHADSPYAASFSSAIYLCDASGGAITFDLEGTSGATGNVTVVLVRKTDSSANHVNVTTDGTDTIEGSAGPYALVAQGDWVWLAAQAGSHEYRIVASGSASGGGGGGGTARTVRHVAHSDSPVTAADGDVILADATGGAITVHPPTGANHLCTVKKVDSSANLVSATPVSGTLDGATGYDIDDQWESIDLIGDGTNYYLT